MDLETELRWVAVVEEVKLLKALAKEKGQENEIADYLKELNETF